VKLPVARSWPVKSAPGAADLVAQERGLALGTILQQNGQIDAARKAYEEADGRTQKYMRELLALHRQGYLRAELDGLASGFQEARRQHGEMIHFLREQKMDAAIGNLNTSLIPKLSRISESAKKLVEHQTAELERVRADADSRQAIGFWLLTALNLVGLCVGIGMFLLVHRLKGSLRSAVAGLTEGSTQLAAAASQVSQASMTLSQVASEQAASLEETSASTEEIHSMTRRNAENAKGAAQRTQEANQSIEEANKSLEQMVASMHQITESSSKISKIIKVIDEIAFQTNILALNAAVEAARAGEAGMGFAVVADEVRNLAQRSAAAAKDTAVLIEESIARADEGRNRMQEVARAITTITESSRRVKTLVDEVRESSQQQEHGIEQIARTVSQLDQVTQKVAASAEEGAAAGQQLTGQSQAVDRVVRTLQQLVGTNGPGEAKCHSQPLRRATALMAPSATPRTGSLVTTKVHAATKPEDVIPLDEDFKEF
jgi:methyl-accepting chemotaxis protein/methyl-accepting chemotaxis protein-1 (serine sensor receptor)